MRAGWPWPPSAARRGPAGAGSAGTSDIGLQAEVAVLAIDAIRLATELAATVRRLEEAQMEFELRTDRESLAIARATIARAGRHPGS